MECKFCGKKVKRLKVHHATSSSCIALQKMMEKENALQKKSEELEKALEEKSKELEKALEEKSKALEEKSKALEESRRERNARLAADENMNKVLQEKSEELEKALQEKSVERVARLIADEKMKCYKELAEKPRVITNQTTVFSNNTTHNKFLNMAPLEFKKAEIKNAIKDSFTKEHMLDGQKGVARFAYENIIKDEKGNLNYICTDPARHIYKFKNRSGKIIKDVKAKKLTKKIAKDVIVKSKDLAEKSKGIHGVELYNIYKAKYDDINHMDLDNSCFRSELASLISK